MVEDSNKDLDQKPDEELDLYSELVKNNGEDHYFVHIANAYRNMAAGLMSERTSWALLIFAMEGANFEQKAPEENQWVGTKTLNWITNSLLLLFCAFVIPGLPYVILDEVYDFKNDGIATTILSSVSMILVLGWLVYFVVRAWREFKASRQAARKKSALLNRFVYFLRGNDVDGQLMESAFKEGQKENMQTASLDVFSVLAAKAKADGADKLNASQPAE